MKRHASSSLAGLSVLLLAASAHGQLQNSEMVCRADEPRLEPHGYLRSLFLDLAGTVPAAEDYARLEGRDDVPDEIIDELLASEGFVQRVVRQHRALLWNNVDNVGLFNARTSFLIARPANLYWRRTPAVGYRGRDVPCLDEPARFDAEGAPIFTVQPDGTRREGFVEVSPYWAPTTTIKVCAADAQTRAVSPSGNTCATTAGLADPGCGCGEALRTCRYGSTVAINRAMARDVELRVAAAIREGRSYLDLFTSRQAFVNGPLVHYLKHQTGVPAGVRFDPLAVDVDLLPDLRWHEVDRWEEIELPQEHAGVLTSPAFLLRFQTNRARSNRFFEAFLCQPFSPPSGGLPGGSDDVLPHPDLQQREGCRYCHALLEPAAAHWGRWTERGAGFLAPDVFPPEREDCLRCAQTGQGCSRDCRLHYTTRTFTSAEEPYLGSLLAYQFLRPEHRRNVEHGPRLMVASAVVDDRFPSCTARRSLEAFFGRGLDREEEAFLGELGRAFVASGYDYKALVKAIVKSPIYRRVR